jgi:hypothetical protein
MAPSRGEGLFVVFGWAIYRSTACMRDTQQQFRIESEGATIT